MFKHSYMAIAAALMPAAIIERIQVVKPVTATIGRPILSGGGRHKWRGQAVSPRVAMRRKSRAARVHGKAKRRAA